MLTLQQQEKLAAIVAAKDGNIKIVDSNLQYDLVLQITEDWITVAVTVTCNQVIAIFVNNDKNKNKADSHIIQYCLNCLRYAKGNYRRRLLETVLKLE